MLTRSQPQPETGEMPILSTVVLRRAAGAAIACAVVVACSGNKAPIPNAFVLAYVGPGNGGSSICGYQSDATFVEIGSPHSMEPSTLTSGDFQPSWGTVHLDCKVDSSGGGNFFVQLSAEVDGPMGGSMTVVGTVGPNGGTGLQGGFTAAGMGSFLDPNDCSITFVYNNAPVPVSGSPIASGRIWAHVDCPNAQQMGTSEMGADGGTSVRTCDGHADFLFQNCD